MNPISKIIAQFGMIHLGLVGASFLVTRTLVKLYLKTVPPELLVKARPMPWLASFMSNYGWWLAMIPVIWCIWMCWMFRREEPDVMLISKSGWLIAVALAGILGASFISSCIVLARPYPTW